MSWRVVVAVVLLASPLALAQLPSEDDADAVDGGLLAADPADPASYPKVVRRPGQVCVQTLEAECRLVEACRSSEGGAETPYVVSSTTRHSGCRPVEGRGAMDVGEADVGGACVPTDTNDDGVIDEAEGCAVAEGALPYDRPVLVFDWRAIEREAEERREGRVTRSPRATESTWTVDVDVVVGQLLDWPIGAQRYAATVASTLASVRAWPLDELSVGATIPLAAGYAPAASCYGDMCWEYPSHAFVNLGDIAIFGTWETRVGRNTRLPIELLVALPTSIGTATPTELEDGPIAAAAVTRGFEESEFFLPKGMTTCWSCPSTHVSFVPSVAVSHGFAHVDLAASLKAPVVLTWGEVSAGVALMAVASLQAMITIAEQQRMKLSVGLRAFGTGGAVLPSYDGRGNPPPWRVVASAGLEPRFEARVGACTVRAGVVIPLVFAPGYSVGHVPAAWGVRVGVGYSL